MHDRLVRKLDLLLAEARTRVDRLLLAIGLDSEEKRRAREKFRKKHGEPLPMSQLFKRLDNWVPPDSEAWVKRVKRPRFSLEPVREFCRGLKSGGKEEDEERKRCRCLRRKPEEDVAVGKPPSPSAAPSPESAKGLARAMTQKLPSPLRRRKTNAPESVELPKERTLAVAPEDDFVPPPWLARPPDDLAVTTDEYAESLALPAARWRAGTRRSSRRLGSRCGGTRPRPRRWCATTRRAARPRSQAAWRTCTTSGAAPPRPSAPAAPPRRGDVDRPSKAFVTRAASDV